MADSIRKRALFDKVVTGRRVVKIPEARTAVFLFGASEYTVSAASAAPIYESPQLEVCLS